MKKQLLSIITATAMTLSILPINAYAYSKDGDFSSDLEYTYEKYGKEKLWDNFIKYDLRISDYDSLTDDEKELCKYIFETEMNSEVDIVCERARRILAGYDVGERITIDELSQYEFIGDYNIYYNYCISDNDELYAPYSDIMTRHCVPDIRHISENYSEYWTDDEKTECIEALGDSFESFGNNVMYESMYLYDESLEGGGVYSGFDYFNDLEFETFESDGLKYMIYPDNTLTVIGVDKNAETISVPESVEDKTVTKIKSDAFRDSAVEEIILPETVKYIEPFAFRECRKLKSINIPNNTECLGYGAFDSCESLKQLEINCPKLYLQKTELFNNCNIEELKINVKSVPYFSQGNIEKIVFGADVKDIEISYLNGDYEIPENVKVAFANKMPKEYDFSELTVPKSIEIFGAYCPKKNADLFSSLNGYAYIPLLDENYTLYGYTGTSAEEYAKEFDIPFVALDEKAEEIKGDANCDGNVNMADAVLIMQSLANPDKYGVNGTDDTHITALGEFNGDMDGKGLTNADALEIQKMLLKLS